jgi:H+/Cl- antiporter ClcA
MNIRTPLAIFFFAPIALTSAVFGADAAGDVFTPVIGRADRMR